MASPRFNGRTRNDIATSNINVKQPRNPNLDVYGDIRNMPSSSLDSDTQRDEQQITGSLFWDENNSIHNLDETDDRRELENNQTILENELRLSRSNGWSFNRDPTDSSSIRAPQSVQSSQNTNEQKTRLRSLLSQCCTGRELFKAYVGGKKIIQDVYSFAGQKDLVFLYPENKSFGIQYYRTEPKQNDKEPVMVWDILVNDEFKDDVQATIKTEDQIWTLFLWHSSN